MNLQAEFGLQVARTANLCSGSQKVLGVERFDHQLHPSGSWIMRLPQDDFYPALGIPPHMKYESDGDPGLAAVLRGSERAQEDLTILLTSQVLVWLLAAPDGHAKNFCIKLLAGGRYQLTPLYDVMSIWSIEGSGVNQYALRKPGLRWPRWAKTSTIALWTSSVGISTAPRQVLFEERCGGRDRESAGTHG